MTAQDLAELADFSRITNVMPSGAIAPTADGELLWDICREVLDTAQLASGSMTPDEQAQYDAALTYLYLPSDGGAGLRQDSVALREYRSCRDALFVAQEAYTAARLTAETSTDPEVAARWAVDEPRLRADVAERQTAWETTGHRAQVEAALQVEQAMGSRSPSRLWTCWQTAFQDVIDTTTDTGGGQIAATAMVPTDALAGGTWPSFRLDASEISTLVAQAPAELRSVLGTGSGWADLDSISFEFRSVGLVRTWFDPPTLAARIWRLASEDGGELSDGAVPPTGRCPSYITGLVLARNIVVQRRQQPPEQLDGARWRDLVTLRTEQRQRMPAVVRDHRTEQESDQQTVVRDHRSLSLTAAMFGVGGATAAVPDHRGDAGGVGGVVIRDHRGDLGSMFAGQVFESAPPVAPVVVIRPPRPEPPIPLPPEPVSTDITVLAYICRLTGRLPNPDPTLAWGSGPTVPQSTPQARTYLVVRGDTLAAIAKRYYGDPTRWRQIAAANDVTDPATLQIGQVLTIP